MSSLCIPAAIENSPVMDAAAIAHLETLAYRHGRSYDSYLLIHAYVRITHRYLQSVWS